MSKEVLEGVIVSFRTGPKTQRPKECIIQFSGVKSAKEAARFIGRKVAWPVGKRAHACMHARSTFSKGLARTDWHSRRDYWLVIL